MCSVDYFYAYQTPPHINQKESRERMFNKILLSLNQALISKRWGSPPYITRVPNSDIYLVIDDMKSYWPINYCEWHYYTKVRQQHQYYIFPIKNDSTTYIHILKAY